MTFSVSFQGERSTILHVEGFTDRVRLRLLETMQELAPQLLAAVKAAEPTRTGALRGETTVRSFQAPTRLSVSAGPLTGDRNAGGKAAAIEYGASRSFAVRAHERRGHLVHAYQRRANIVAEHYLERATDAMSEPALAAMQQAIDDAGAEEQ